MTASRSLPILLTLTLLFAQQAGQAHALSHLDSDSLKDGVSHTTLCAKCCDVRTAVVIRSGDGLANARCTVPRLRCTPSSTADSVRRTATAFQSRAPPSLA